MSSVSSVRSLKLKHDCVQKSLAMDDVDDDFMDGITFGLLIISCAQLDEEYISDGLVVVVVLSVRPRPTHLRILVRNELPPPDACLSIDGLSTMLLVRLPEIFFGSNCIVLLLRLRLFCIAIAVNLIMFLYDCSMINSDPSFLFAAVILLKSSGSL